MAKIKLHNPELAANSVFSNFIVESVISDPTVVGLKNAGRIWFNTNEKKLKGTFINQAGDALEIKSLADNADVAGINGSITAEVERATAAEAALTNALNIETAARIAGDSSLDTRVTAVESQVNGKTGDLTNLTTDAKDTIVAAVNEIDANIDAEVARATAAESALNNTLTTAINAEVARATAAESALNNTLTTAITAEVTRATAAEAALNNTLTTAITAEVTRATTAEAALTNALNTEIAARIAGDAALTSDLNSNFLSKTTTDAQTVISDTTFNGDLTTDGNLSVEGDTILNGDTIIGDSVSPTTLSINSQVITATDVTVGKDLKIIGNLLVQGAQTIVETEILKIADNIITLNNGIGDVEPTENAGLEVDRGTEGVQTIIQWNEILDRVEVAENNAGVISLVKVATASDIAAETTRATAAEAALTNALSTETTARIAGDDVLTTAINAEVTRATAAEAALTNSLNAEVVNRTNAESALGLRIDNVNTAAGIVGDVYAANKTANFISTATSLVSADNLLDAALKTTIDDLASTAVNKGSSLVGYNGYVEADVNIVNPTVEIAAGTIETAIAEMAASINIKMQELENRYVKGEVANIDKADTYTIAHNLDTEFVDVSVQVYDESDLVWRFDLVVVEVIDANTVKVSLASGTAAQIRYVIHGY